MFARALSRMIHCSWVAATSPTFACPGITESGFFFGAGAVGIVVVLFLLLRDDGAAEQTPREGHDWHCGERDQCQ